MREIKFDAIYKPTGEHFNPVSINFNDNTVVGNFSGVIGDWCHFSLDGNYGDVILRQNTGLKDKNGVEIYEGDILHVFEDGHYGGEYYAPIEWVDYENDGEQWAFFGTVCLKVKEIKHYNPNVNTIFTRGFLTRRYGSCIELSEMTSRNYFIQVIGNIYQNANLLEESK